MCSIVGSFSKDKLLELCELNRYRGEHSHSLTIYSTHQRKIRYLKRSLGAFKFDPEYFADDDYFIVHQQAPTGENTGEDAIHPAQYYNVAMDRGFFLWHNGILKPSTIKALQEEYKVKASWDSLLLLWRMIHSNPLNLDDIDGSFSCLMAEGLNYDSKLLLFRNEIAPMFYDNDFNISSTKFEGSISIRANVVYKFIPEKKQLIETEVTFKTKNNPYVLSAPSLQV